MKLFRIAVSFLLLTATTIAFAQAKDGAKVVPNEAMLMKLDSDFNDATQARRLDGWMEFMADDVVVRRGENVIGREALRKALTDEWADPGHSLTWHPVGARMVAGARLGFTWGRWTLEAAQKDGSKLHLTGDYLTIWAKQKDESWKVIWDGGGADPAAGKP